MRHTMMNESHTMTESPIATEAEFREEVEKIIQSAPPHRVLKLRKIQAECDGIRRKYKANPQMIRELIYNKMITSLIDLNESLKPLKS